ncbi:MAG TPA: aldehyde dehydrogenase family protein [Pyrinomonadaceae bacterium]|nr:aldehyde dehydrogenase family protein [Pyrinomonadaceae bacterium]
MSAVLPAQSNEIISTNPATGEEIGRVAMTTPEEVAAAFDRARETFAKWKDTSFDKRKRLVMAAREVILAEMDDIAELISRESGKPVAEALSMEIAPVLDLMQYFARNAEKLLKPKRVGIGLYSLLGRSSKIIYKPYGVVGIIPAWNYPFSIPLGEAVMALMAGNTVVIKPSELTPFIGLKIGEIFVKAGFPANCVQIVSGAGETGAALVDSAPDKIMFTGSVATGKRIAAAAAKNLTSTVLELGGKDPMIVFEDANLELAAGAAVWGAFCNAGQSCSSVERLYVHESIADELTKRIVEKTNQLKVGSGLEADTSVGAMSSERQLKTVYEHVEAFKDAGAEVLTGGEVIVPGFNEPTEKVEMASGFFYPPTVIKGATNDMMPMQEETFGPTLPIATFRTEDEAINLANDSEFGLTASVWTKDYTKGRRVAEQIEAGSVCVNEVLYTHGIGQTPWGGFKNSGRGRTHGALGLMELVQPQHIHVNRIAILPDAWWMPYSETAVATFRKFATHFASGSLLKTNLMLPQLFKRVRELMKRK